MSGPLEITVDGRSRTLAPPGPVTIGRAAECDVRVDDPRVSRQHATLRVTDDGWELHDASRFGTWRDGERIERCSLVGVVEVRLGDPEAGPTLRLATGPVPGHQAATAEPAANSPAAAPGSPAAAPSSAAPAPGSPASQPAAAATPEGGHHRPTGTKVSAHRPGALTRIGRAPDNDIVVGDILVSKYHAELRRSELGLELVDLGSGNGTFVNARRTERALLQDLDLVGIGLSEFRLVGDRLEEYRDTGAVTFEASGITVEVGELTIVDDVSFALTERSLLGVVGPSGSGKSTLVSALAGLPPPTAGTVTYAGRDLYADYEELRTRIGFVPQDDVLHGELPVRRALEHAARLRFPADVTAAERDARIDEVLAELNIAHRADVPVEQLSGGERKRTSVALELLTRPSLLFLDEPASGLDPGLARTLMQLLRELADGGRTVIVVTHEIDNLRLCDQLVVLAPGGVPAYVGPAQTAPTHFGRDELAEVFADLTADPTRDWRATPHVPRQPRREDPATVVTTTAARSWGGQLRTLTARSFEVLLADRRNLALLVAQAPLLGLLMLVALPAGELAPPVESEVRFVSAAGLVLFLLMVGATWLGANNAVREIARELVILRRERTVGVSLSAYVGSKALVLGAVTTLQAIVLTGLVLARQGGPTDAILLGFGPLEITVIVILTGLAAMAQGLLVSALAGSAQRATSILPVVLILQLITSAGVVLPEIVDRPVLREVSLLSSAQWGVAGAAATAELNELQAFGERLRELRTVDASDPVPVVEAMTTPAAPNPRWAHTPRAWLTAVGGLLALIVVPLVATTLALRRRDPGR